MRSLDAPPLMPLEIARRRGGQVELRATPAHITWQLPGMPTADGHTVDVTVALGLRPVDRPADRQMLAEHFLADTESLIVATLRTHFAVPLEAAARAYAGVRPAADVLAGVDLAPDLTAAAERTAFACGFEVVPPVTVSARSLSLEHAAHHAQAEARRSEQLDRQQERLRKAGELMRSFQAARAAAPGVSADDLIARVAPGDQADLWELMLKADEPADPAARFGAVCGNAVVLIDPSGATPPAVTRLPDTLGPLRSVRPTTLDGQAVWLVGARAGVMIVDPDAPATPRLFKDVAHDSAFGFKNPRLDVAARQLRAEHSDRGVVTWDLARPDGPISAAPLTALAGARVGRFEVSSGRFLVVAADGAGVFCDADGRPIQEAFHRHEPVVAAALIRLFGEPRLLIAGPSGPVRCVNFDGKGVLEYRSAHHAPRALLGGGGFVAALTADRHRLILWAVSDGASPARNINLFALTGHRAADLVQLTPLD